MTRWQQWSEWLARPPVYVREAVLTERCAHLQARVAELQSQRDTLQAKYDQLSGLALQKAGALAGPLINKPLASPSPSTGLTHVHSVFGALARTVINERKDEAFG